MSPHTNPLSRGLRPVEYTGGRSRYNFRWEFGYLHEVHSQGYREAIAAAVVKDLAQQAIDKDMVQKLLDNRKESTECNN